MAQELFRSEETKERLRKEQLVKRGFELWCMYAEEYRVLPFKYFFYLVEKKEAKLRLNKIKSASCRPEEYPDIPFFYIWNPADVLAWLEDSDVDVLEGELNRVEYTLETNYLYRSMKAWVAETIYILSHKKPGPNSLAFGIPTNAIPKHRRVPSPLGAE